MRFGIGSLLRYDGFEQVGEGTYGHVYRARDKHVPVHPQPLQLDRGSAATAPAAGGAGEGEGSGWVALKRLIVSASKETAGVSVAVLCCSYPVLATTFFFYYCSDILV
jgi:hypothetical protein